MRRTTIILLGIISSLLLLSVIFILYQSTLDLADFKMDNQKSNLSGKVDSISISSYKILKIKEISRVSDNHTMGKIFVKPAKYAMQTGYFYFPNELLSMVTKRISGDTLIIQLNYDEKKLDAIKERYKCGKLNAFFHLYTSPTSALSICNEVNELDTELKGVSLSEAVVNSCSSIVVDSCNINNLNLSGWYPSINLKNSKINIFSLDLENLNNWNVHNCQINEEHLTGNGYHAIHLPKSECKRMTWKGKTKEASLHVDLDSDKASISF